MQAGMSAFGGDLQSEIGCNIFVKIRGEDPAST
jgi:hypothetical protein